MHCNGGSTFAEHPEREAPDARIIWHARLDPGVLHIEALPAAYTTAETVDVARLRPWLTSVVGRDGCEHAVLSDGWHRIRLELDNGSLRGDGPVSLRYHMTGVRAAELSDLTLRRFLHLYRYRRFAAMLFMPDPRINRWIELLRVHDALRAGATQRDIAIALFGDTRVRDEWGGGGGSLRQRVVRMVSDARRIARGGYRSLLLGRDASRNRGNNDAASA
jgi:hypothetical protein